MAIVFISRSDRAEDWLEHMRAAAPDEDIRVWPDVGDPAEVDIAVVAMPPEGELRRYPNLKAVLSLWAGVDSVLADPEFPRHLPLIRMDEPGLNEGMGEYVLYHALKYHLRDHLYRAQQPDAEWQPHERLVARHRKVGVLGLGVIGRFVCQTLAAMHFDVAGWSRSQKSLPGIQCLSGPDGLRSLLARSEILVSLLPMTAETEGILDQTLFDALPKGACLINAGRGPHLNETDLLAALDDGRIAHATLDVFATEPLPAEHPLWRHPKIDVTPHIASITQVDTGVEALLKSIAQVRSGAPLVNVIDPARGY